MPCIGVVVIGSLHEECLQALLGARDDRRVISEEQTTQHRHQDDAHQVEFASASFKIAHKLLIV